MKVSIITVVYNVGESIIPTFESVKALNHEQIEYVVIDGGSTDSTLQIIDQYSSLIDVFVSEPDRGIYDAMNKGINRSSGDWIIFINTGDTIISIPFEKLDTKYDAVVGCTIDEKGNVFRPQFDTTIKLGNKLPHQGLFYNRKVLPQFDIQYRIFADYDLNLKMFKSKKNILLLDDIIAQHNLDGVSMNKKHLRELYKVVYNNYGFIPMGRLFFHYKIDGIKKRIKGL